MGGDRLKEDIRIGNCIIKITENNIREDKDYSDEFYDAIAKLLIKNNIELDIATP
jgi:hypothetical protein